MTTWPPESPATQSEGEAHETESRLSSIVVVVQTPDAGSVETSSTPPEPTATQSEADAQLTSNGLPVTVFDVHLPPAGSVVADTLPCPSTDTQRFVVGHDPELNAGVVALRVQAIAPAVGRVEVNTCVCGE